MFPKALVVLFSLLVLVSAGRGQTGSGANLRIVSELNDRALAHGRSGHLDSSLHCLIEASKILPLPEILNNIGNLESALGRNESARHYYYQAIQADRDNAYAWFNLGLLSWETDEKEQALDYVNCALQDSRAGEFRNRLPSAFVFAQNWPRLRASVHAVPLPGPPAMTMRLQPDLPKAGKTDVDPRPGDDFLKAVFTTPSNDTGIVLYGLARYDEALFYFLAAQEESPRCINARINAGLCHFKAGRFRECRTALEDALFWTSIFSCDPSPSSCAIIAQNLFCEETENGRIFSAGPGPGSALSGNLPRVHFALAISFRQTGEPERAEVELKRALALDPEFSEAWVELGRLLRRNGNSAEVVDAMIRGSLARSGPERPDVGFGTFYRIHFSPLENKTVAFGAVQPVSLLDDATIPARSD